VSRTLRILSRKSPLALLQVDEALPALKKAFPDAEFEAKALESIGDHDLQTPLTDPSIPTDFFTRELDSAQIRGDADLVIHSAKDLPDPLPEGLVIGALLPARETRDALCVRPGVNLETGGIIGTSSPVREAQVRKIWPAVRCKAIRGNIGQRLKQMDAGDYDAVIIAACALERLGWADRIHTLLDYETTPQQGRLAITVRTDRADLIEALHCIDVRRQAGLVALVGCPADARLLGGHARDLLDAADIVLHDRLVPAEILSALGDRAEYVGKQGHSHSTTQAHIHRRILHEAEAGKLVVRLHGGDPGVLGHLGETLDYCHAWNLRTEVVPAVSAAQIAAARAQCSLTHRDEGRSITFLSGHNGLTDHPLGALSPEHGNLAVYMGVRDIADIRDRLLEAGRPQATPVTAAMDLGTTEEQILPATLADIHTRPLRAPAVLMVGPRPHLPRYTLFTGTDPRKFLRHGPLLPFPMIQLTPRPLEERAKNLSEGLETWDGIIFPSGQAVSWVMEALMSFADVRALHGKQLLAVGPQTARALAAFGLRADAVPEGFGGAAALAGLPNLKPGTYGYLTSDQSPVDSRRAALQPAGIQIEPAVFYENQATDPSALPKQPFERVLFTAGSTVRAYFTRFPDEVATSREWIGVGTSTHKEIERFGVKASCLS
jgi:uroporphyrinogen III methyltransferase/synthase